MESADELPSRAEYLGEIEQVLEGYAETASLNLVESGSGQLGMFDEVAESQTQDLFATNNRGIPSIKTSYIGSSRVWRWWISWPRDINFSIGNWNLPTFLPTTAVLILF